MSKPVFIDLGFHHGEGLAAFRKRLSLNSDWDVYAFEPNPSCHRYFPDFCLNGWHYSPKAAWTEPVTLPLFQEDWKASGSGSPVKDATNITDGWATTLMPKSLHKGLNRYVRVPAFDLAAFLKRFAGREVHVKMDIEGAEFPVLRHLLATRAIGLIDNLYFEFHERLLPNETEISRNALQTECQKYTAVHYHG